MAVGSIKASPKNAADKAADTKEAELSPATGHLADKT
jgi:hypothetical protein